MSTLILALSLALTLQPPATPDPGETAPDADSPQRARTNMRPASTPSNRVDTTNVPTPAEDDGPSSDSASAAPTATQQGSRPQRRLARPVRRPQPEPEPEASSTTFRGSEIIVREDGSTTIRDFDAGDETDYDSDGNETGRRPISEDGDEADAPCEGPETEDGEEPVCD